MSDNENKSTTQPNVAGSLRRLGDEFRRYQKARNEGLRRLGDGFRHFINGFDALKAPRSPATLASPGAVRGLEPTPDRHNHRGKRYSDAEREGFRRDIAVAIGNAPHITDRGLAERLKLPRSSFKCLELNTFAARVRRQYCSNLPRLKRGQRKVDAMAEAPEDAE